MGAAAQIPELQSAAEIVAKVEGREVDDAELSDDPKLQKEYSFTFEEKDGRGKVWRGEFTNRVLTIKQQRSVKLAKAQMAAGLPVQALDADLWTMNEMIAHMTVSLTQKPKWAKDLEELYDPSIVYKLYEEVASHEAIFHGREQTDPASEGAAEDGAG